MHHKNINKKPVVNKKVLRNVIHTPTEVRAEKIALAHQLLAFGRFKHSFVNSHPLPTTVTLQNIYTFRFLSK
jgi:hypothetical protein